MNKMYFPEEKKLIRVDFLIKIPKVQVHFLLVKKVCALSVFLHTHTLMHRYGEERASGSASDSNAKG
jgi:hypothetical protein